MKNKFFIVLTIALSFTWASKVFAYDDSKTDENCAEALNSLGLFKGDGESFNLDAPLKRSEAAVMVTRLMGAESQAVSENLSSPFKDVPDWASAYVGWLYQNKLIYGIDSTTYGSDQNISGEEYMTILLRCLGYSDAEGGDFKFNEVYTFAEEIFGPSMVYYLDNPNTNNFVRYDCTYLTVKLLFCNMKGSDMLLSDYLISEKVFTKEAYAEAVKTLLGTTIYLSHQVNEEGYIIPYFEEMPINNLGRSEIKFASVESSADGFLIVKGLDGKTYTVDKDTLITISELSGEEFDGYAHEAMGGTAYYIEKETGTDGYPVIEGGVTVKLLDSEGVANTVISFDNCYLYSDPFNEGAGLDETTIYILGKRNGVIEYVYIDTVNWEVTTIPIENSEYIGYCGIGGKLLVMGSDGETKNLYLIGNGKLLDSMELNTRIRKAHIYSIGETLTAADMETFYLIENDKLSILADFDRFVTSVAKNSQGYYIVSSHMVDYDSSYIGESSEMGLIDNQGNYSVIMPAEIVSAYHDYIRLSSVDDNGDIIFGATIEYAGLADDFTYKYNVNTKKVTVIDFYARGSFTEEYKNERMATEQERVNELHK